MVLEFRTKDSNYLLMYEVVVGAGGGGLKF